MLVFNGKTYTYQEEQEEDGTYGYTAIVARDENGNRVEISHWDKVKLEDVQVGDWVVVVRSGRTIPVSHTLRKVERTTKTQFTVNGTRYKKNSGHKVGSGTSYYRNRTTYIIAYNPEDEINFWAQHFTNKESMRVKNELKVAKDKLKARFFELLDNSNTLEELEEILK